MTTTVLELKSKSQTGNGMYDLCYQYNTDLDDIYIYKNFAHVPLSSLPITDYYDYFRRYPYKIDKKPIEVIGRPLRLARLLSLDCKKKSVFIGAYASYHKIPFRFVAVSGRPDKIFHHVFPELKQGGKWVTYDATYPEYYIGMEKPNTAREVL